MDKLVRPYFETVAEWYRALHIGLTGGVLQGIVDRRLGDPFFGIFLNPGHQIHYDEWVNTPVGPGSAVELQHPRLPAPVPTGFRSGDVIYLMRNWAPHRR
ncbi:MAG TPA: hypothetical protein VF148_08555 [Acidimicrobiia bacterium]